jgi:hypothetical protein
MKHTIAAVIAFFITRVAFGQTDTVPVEYRPVKEIYGDLDKDGKDEKVVVYNVKAVEDDMNGIDRELIIFKKEKTGWMIWHRSRNAIFNSTDGGMMGDPFDSIGIRNGVLVISHWGGSSWKWNTTDRYRYQQGRFELIGYTSTSGKPCEYWATFDYNLATGRIVYNAEAEKCDDEEKEPVVYKKENEIFFHKLSAPVILEQRNKTEVKIISPKYKEVLYL